MFPVLFKLGPIMIYTYGFFVFLGVVLGYFLSLKEAKRNNIDLEVFKTIIFWTIVFGFLGARLFYIITEFRLFILNPFKTLFSRSGFVFYGGVLSGLLVLYILTKKHKINFLKFSDILSIAIPAGHAIGRIGCFSYGCCYGKPTTSFIGVIFPPTSPVIYTGQRVIPTQLIESFFLFLIFLIIKFIFKKKKFDGQPFFVYLILYSIIRFFIEFLRGDPRGEFLYLSTSQWISTVIFFISAFFYFYNLKKLKKQI
ncbi:MAG: prolipoprotein diacylglyceryl transferase [Candidatus Omnitrophica bacterium]|nr:prolipoprotein diacylglyceryl transferase [Candidatus Omnitrophota bacterium]